MADQSLAADATIDDVAAAAGVSYQTVSRVINHSPNVKETTRVRVVLAMDQLRYRPNRTARHLASRRSTVIGIVCFGSGQYGPNQVIASIRHEARDRGYHVMICDVTDLKDESIHAAIDELCGHRVVGIILSLALGRDLPGILEVCRGTPVVTLDSTLDRAAPAVCVDQRLGSRVATEHLIELGHRKIAHLSGPEEWKAGFQRKAAWLAALKRANLEPGPCLSGDWKPESGYRLAKELIENHRSEFTAIVSANDAMALGAIKAFLEAGIRIPDDVSVVGFDDVPEAAFYAPSLTTVYQDFSAIGRYSVQALLHAVNHRERLPLRFNIRPTLVVRQSTARVPKSALKLPI